MFIHHQKYSSGTVQATPIELPGPKNFLLIYFDKMKVVSVLSEMEIAVCSTSFSWLNLLLRIFYHTFQYANLQIAIVMCSACTFSSHHKNLLYGYFYSLRLSFELTFYDMQFCNVCFMFFFMFFNVLCFNHIFKKHLENF